VPQMLLQVYLQMTNEIMADDSPVHYWQHDGPKSTVCRLHDTISAIRTLH
jgi:hypothetical protein